MSGLLRGLPGASVPGETPPVARVRLEPTVQVYASGGDQSRISRQQLVTLHAQGAYLSSYLDRGRRTGSGERLDPVLEAHLRVAPEGEK